MTVPAILFIDKWPRRRVMIAGSFLMAVFMFTEGALSAVYGHAVPGGLNGVTTVTWVVPHASASKAIIACSYLFIAAYAPTWGPVGWYVLNSTKDYQQLANMTQDLSCRDHTASYPEQSRFDCNVRLKYKQVLS